MGSHLIPSSLVVWKDVSERALSDLNRTVSLDYTDLDLTAYTSANAKFAILLCQVKLDSYTSGHISMYVRKNGTTPAYVPRTFATNEDCAFKTNMQLWIVGLDDGQVVEYFLRISAVAQADFTIDVLGYIE